MSRGPKNVRDMFETFCRDMEVIDFIHLSVVETNRDKPRQEKMSRQEPLSRPENDCLGMSRTLG